MHLQTLAITINQSLIGHDRYYEVGFRAGTPQPDRVCEATNAPVGISSGRTVCVSRWRGFAPTSSEKRLLRAINKQRQGITMEVVPCLLLCIPYIARFGSIAAYVYTWPVRTQEKGQVLAYRGVLSTDGMVYSTQQIGI